MKTENKKVKNKKNASTKEPHTMYPFKNIYERINMYYKNEATVTKINNYSNNRRRRRRRSTKREADEMFATNYFCGGILRHHGL
jgi:hypothetical protein